jgi:hypothetical protein
MEQSASIGWEPAVKDSFNRLLEKVPVFLRGVAQDKVGQRAEAIVKKEGRSLVSEKDLIDAFFAETPFGFHGPMKNDMKELGIDYKKYGHAD